MFWDDKTADECRHGTKAKAHQGPAEPNINNATYWPPYYFTENHKSD